MLIPAPLRVSLRGHFGSPIPRVKPIYLHIYPILLHVVFPTAPVMVRNGPLT
jgi:hypothetical protein